MSMIQGFCYDDETGEISLYDVNKETGEPSVNYDPPPQLAPAPPPHTCPPSKQVRFSKGYSTKSKKFETLKANILAGSNTVSYRMLLIPSIPTSILFPGLVVTILMLLEIFLHVKCHKNNKDVKDSNVYYRSPFHAVTSIFCGVCRESNLASKVGQMQDKRRCHYDYLKGIAI